MEAHFLSEFVKNVDRSPAEPWYNPSGDCIMYQMVNEATVAERIDDVLTIYHSAITNNPIGFQIKGVQAIARRFGWDGILVESTEDTDGLQDVSISALLLAAYEEGPKTIGRRKAYAEALGAPGGGKARMQVPDLVPNGK